MVVTAVELRAASLVAGGVHACALTTAGEAHSCGLTGAGKAYCWGRNEAGELGSDANVGTLADNPSPVAVSGGLTFGVP